MINTPDKIIKDLKNKIYKPVYCIYGDEDYFIDELVHYFENNIIFKNHKAFDFFSSYGKDMSFNKILSYSNRAPMLAKRHLVLIKNASEINGLNKAEDQKIFIDYVNKPNKNSILVLVFKHYNFDARKQFTKIISNKTVLIKCKKLYPNQIPGWIDQYFEKKGYQINQKAIYLLIENTGDDLCKISREINKILINFKQKTKIDENIINTYVTQSRSYTIFDFQKAIIFKNKRKLNIILESYNSQSLSNNLSSIVSILLSFFIKVLEIHYSKNKSKQYLASLVKVSPYFINDYILATKNYSIEQIETVIQILHQTDLNIKNINSPQLSIYQQIKQLITKILMS